MCAAPHLENTGVHVHPSLETLKLTEGGHLEFFRELHLLCLLVDFKQALWHDCGGCKNSGELGTQKVALLAWEARVGVEGGIEVAREDVLDLACTHDVLGSGVWQLDPVVERIIGDPVYKLVDTFAALFKALVCTELFSQQQFSAGNPVVFLGTEDLATEA